MTLVRWALFFSSIILLIFTQCIFAEELKTVADTKTNAKQRLQKNEGLKLEDYSAPAITLDESLQNQKDTKQGIQYDLKEILKEADSARTDVKNIQLSIAEIRASALKNNLALQVVQADPRIAETRVSEERAKFDNIIYANLKYGELDLPSMSGDRVNFSSNNPALSNQTVKLTRQNQRVDSMDGEVGIAVPLRTGGSC
jgi:outer membrane protein